MLANAMLQDAKSDNLAGADARCTCWTSHSLTAACLRQQAS